MKAMNFYTANGWAGSNYDSKLSTKEIDFSWNGQDAMLWIGQNGELITG